PVVDLAGGLAWGELEPTTEIDLHLGVYRRFDAGAVVHTHAPMATALSCVLDELPCVHYQMLLLGGTVRVAPYETFGTPERAAARSAGAIGTDAVGEMLVGLLDRAGVDTALLARRDDVQTSASVLPIRPSGERPAFHVVGANAAYGPEDVDYDALAGASHLHLGGPEFMGGEAAARILAFARERGIVTSADVLAPGEV